MDLQPAPARPAPRRFIPSREQRELRELVRYRRSLIEERSREFNRIQKVLEGVIIKLSSVVSDVLGKSSRSMIERSLPAKPTRSPLRVGPSKNETEKMNDKHALHGLIGPNYYEECMRTHVTKQAIRKLEFLGYKATIEAMNQTA